MIGDRKRIGLEFDHVTLQNMDKFKVALPDASFADVGVTTMKLRLIKSDEEISLIKNGKNAFAKMVRFLPTCIR